MLHKNSASKKEAAIVARANQIQRSLSKSPIHEKISFCSFETMPDYLGSISNDRPFVDESNKKVPTSSNKSRRKRSTSFKRSRSKSNHSISTI